MSSNHDAPSEQVPKCRFCGAPDGIRTVSVSSWEAIHAAYLERVDAVINLGRQIVRVEAERDAARLAMAEAGIVLEALWAAEHDGIALAPTTKAAIFDAIRKVRAVLQPSETQGDATR